jgi:hypothetical protein
VQEVLDSRRRYNQVEYLVLWKGYPRSEATWEKEGNLKNSPILVAEFHAMHPKAVKSKHIASSMFSTPDFLEWRQHNIRPSYFREDAHPKKGVMSQIPNTSHYSFLNSQPVKPQPRTGHVIPSPPFTSSHISPFTSPQGSPTPKARVIALPL